MNQEMFHKQIEYLAALYVFKQLEKEKILSKKDMEKIENALNKKYDLPL